MTNLQLLMDAEKDLELADKRRLEDYFVGALSVYADPVIWQKALDAAVEHIKIMLAGREAIEHKEVSR